MAEVDICCFDLFRNTSPNFHLTDFPSIAELDLSHFNEWNSYHPATGISMRGGHASQVRPFNTFLLLHTRVPLGWP